MFVASRGCCWEFLALGPGGPVAPDAPVAPACSLSPEEFEMGLGIHGEPGAYRERLR